MSAQLRVSGVEMYHHIYAWGNDRHPIFKEEHHYQTYLDLLSKHSRLFKVDVIAYALMEWHVHLFIYDTKSELSGFMQRVHGDYARYYNHRVGRTGHVFGERFNNKIVQCNNYGIRLSKYIHCQAVKAGIVKHPADYRWTSYAKYIGNQGEEFVKPDIILQQFGVGNEARERYNEFMRSVEKDPVDWGNRSFMIIGDDDFIDKCKELYNLSSRRAVSRKLKIRIYQAVRKESGQDLRTMIKPKGIAQRRKRREIFALLVNKYGFTRSAVADAFKMSIMGISKAVKNE